MVSQNDEMGMGKSATQLDQRSVDGRVDVADSCLKHQILTQMHTTQMLPGEGIRNFSSVGYGR